MIKNKHFRIEQDSEVFSFKSVSGRSQNTMMAAVLIGFSRINTGIIQENAYFINTRLSD